VRAAVLGELLEDGEISLIHWNPYNKLLLYNNKLFDIFKKIRTI
jgi:hypothetical protein